MYSGQFPYRPSAAAVLGKAFHSNYELWEQEGRAYPLSSTFIDFYRAEIASEEVNTPLDKWVTAPRVKDVANDIEIRAENGLLMCESYEEHCRESPWHIIQLEQKFTLDLGDFEVWGAVDSLLGWPSGNETIRDLKTGNREKSGFQLGVYKYAIRKSLGVTIEWGEYYYTKDGKAVEVDLKRYTDTYIEDQLVKLDKAIMAELFLANPGDACTFCGVKEYCREVGTKSLA